MYNTNSQIKIKTSKLNSSLRVFSDAYILASEAITVTRHRDNNAKRADERNKKVIF